MRKKSGRCTGFAFGVGLSLVPLAADCAIGERAIERSDRTEMRRKCYCSDETGIRLEGIIAGLLSSLSVRRHMQFIRCANRTLFWWDDLTRAAMHLLGIGAICRLPEESGDSWREHLGFRDVRANDNQRHLAFNRTALPIRCDGQPCSSCCCRCVVELLDPLIRSCLARLDPHEERRKAASFDDVYLPTHQTLSPPEVAILALN